MSTLPETNPKHSPGPWTVEEKFDPQATRYIIRSAPVCHPTLGKWVAEVNSHIAINNSKKDVYLIAAAPELLAVLEMLVHVHGARDQYIPKSRIEEAQAIIAKARGES